MENKIQEDDFDISSFPKSWLEKWTKICPPPERQKDELYDTWEERYALWAYERKGYLRGLKESKVFIDCLKPFADMFKELTETKIKQGGVVFKYNSVEITVADLKNAFIETNPLR